MTLGLFENVVKILEAIVPPHEVGLDNAVTIPLWGELVKRDVFLNKENTTDILLLTLVLLVHSQQGDLREIKETLAEIGETMVRTRQILERLDGKELGTGIRVKQTPGPPA